MIPETDTAAFRRRIKEYYKRVEHKEYQLFKLINFDEVQMEQFKTIYKQGWAKITIQKEDNMDKKELIVTYAEEIQRFCSECEYCIEDECPFMGDDGCIFERDGGSLPIHWKLNNSENKPKLDLESQIKLLRNDLHYLAQEVFLLKEKQ